jgi:hypothetical protein
VLLSQSPPSLKSVSDSSDSEDNIPIHETMSDRVADEDAKFGEVQSGSSDSEGDDVPVALLLKAVKDKVETVMPEGEQAVGAGIARDFGTELGVFKGKVHHVQAVRRRHVYHVKYEDGDSEDFDADEYKYAYELRQAIDTGVVYEPDGNSDCEETISGEEASEDECAKPKKKITATTGQTNYIC